MGNRNAFTSVSGGVFKSDGGTGIDTSVASDCLGNGG